LFVKYLAKIGQIYFSIPIKNKDQDNPFNSIMRMFIGSDSTDVSAAGNTFFNAKEATSFMDLDDDEDLD
jgi:hypothetical protein